MRVLTLGKSCMLELLKLSSYSLIIMESEWVGGLLSKCNVFECCFFRLRFEGPLESTFEIAIIHALEITKWFVKC